MKIRKRAFKGAVSILVLFSLTLLIINLVFNGHTHHRANGTIYGTLFND